MTSSPAHEPHPNFQIVAAEARALREQLVKANGKNDQVKAAALAPIKVEALRLLGLCGAPAPLVMLLAELIKSPKASDARSLLDAGVCRARLAAAQIEAARPLHPQGERPSDMPDGDLELALAAVPGIKKVKRLAIRNWRIKDPAYWALVFMHRNERDGYWMVPPTAEQKAKTAAEIQDAEEKAAAETVSNGGVD